MAAGDKNAVQGGNPTEPVAAYEDAAADRVQAVVPTSPTGVPIPGDATNGMDVDVTRLPALPAGTNNIGDVDVLTLPALPAGTNNIGDVDVLTVPADQTVKVRGSHASTISSRTTGLQTNPVLDVRLVEDNLGTKLGQDLTAPLYAVQAVPYSNIYSFSTGELTLATATGTKEMLTVFHTSSDANNIQLLELRWHPTGTAITAGRAIWEYQYITAENGTPGGTSITPQPMHRGNTFPANINIRQGVTGAPTTTGQVFGRRSAINMPVAANQVILAQLDSESGARIWDAAKQGACFLRGGTAEGVRVTLNILATLTGAQTGYLSGTLYIGA